MGGGAFFAPLVHVDREGGYVECPRLSTRGGEGVKIGSKLVYVVVECPLTAMGCRQCLSLSVVHLKGKHCRKPHCRNGMFGQLLFCEEVIISCHQRRSRGPLSFEFGVSGKRTEREYTIWTLRVKKLYFLLQCEKFQTAPKKNQGADETGDYIANFSICSKTGVALLQLFFVSKQSLSQSIL